MTSPVIKSVRLRDNRIATMYVQHGMWVIETADRRKYRVPLPAPESAGVPQQDDEIIGGGSSAFGHINETPTGLINGSNDTFSLLDSPITNGLMLFRNGVLQQGDNNDYTLTGNTVVFNAIPQSGDVLLATYSASGVFNVEEVPSGAITGSNDTFYLTGIPAGIVMLFKNGVRQRPGVDNDYTRAGNVITFNAWNLPQTGDILLADF